MPTFGKRGGGGRRSSARSTGPLAAVYATLNKSGQAYVMDLSETGAKLRGNDLPQEGEEVSLSVDKVELFGTVAWVKHDECGVAFESRLSLRDTKLLQHKVAVTSGVRPEIRTAFDDWRTGLAR